MKIILSLFFLSFITACNNNFVNHKLAFTAEQQSHAIVQLTTNGRINPLGIAIGDISFGWKAMANYHDSIQVSYQIRLGTEPSKRNIWDSGLVMSDEQVDIILPSNISLKGATRYFWQVRTWNEKGVVSEWSQIFWFETGLLSTNDWSGANWIVRPELKSDWADYIASIDFTLVKGAVGMLIHSTVDTQNAYMMQFDVTDHEPLFKVHKKTNGKFELLKTIDLTALGYSNTLFDGTSHTVQFEVMGTSITTKLDGIIIDTHSEIAFSNGVIGFRTVGKESALIHQVKVIQYDTNLVLLDTRLDSSLTGFIGNLTQNGSLIITGAMESIYVDNLHTLPLFRRDFNAKPGISSARLYASALGLYEVTINGQKAGNQFLSPGWTDYTSRVQSQTYDITDLVQSGSNAIGVTMADGWYHGTVGLNWHSAYGDKIAFIAKIKVIYNDGSSEWFSTNNQWKASYSPYILSDLQKGEIYNANFEQQGWDTNSFNDITWLPVETIKGTTNKLVPQPDEPIREIDVLTAISRVEVAPGTWIYDLGQNMVGVPRVVVNGQKGETLSLRHAEELYRVGTKKGQMYTDNLRTASATDLYTFSSTRPIIYQPKFTQHGFRYIEITGISTPPTIENVHGVVLSSDLPGGGNLITSHSMLNRLIKNIWWGQTSNFLSIPTDTPARDERLGWTGDINVFAPTAARFKDTRAFLRKWMQDVRDEQKLTGNIPAVVPQPLDAFDSTGVGWSDAVITIPYSVWQATGDKQIIRENWQAMNLFYQFIYDSATSDGDLLEQGRSSWFSGDWLSLEKDWDRLEEHKVIATAYFAENTRMMSEMAEAVGDLSKAASLAILVPKIRTAFVKAYRNNDGSIYTGSQTAYAITIGMNMITDPKLRSETGEMYINKLNSDDHHLQTGFLGTPWLLPALSTIERNDLAMKLLLNESYPSWGFPISMGATTMWERWNSIQEDYTFGPVDMNSFNHYAYGSVGDWMFKNIGGISKLTPAYKTSLIAPLIGIGGLSYASSHQETVYGKLAVSWTLSDAQTTLNIEIPVNTSAEVHMPLSSYNTVYEGNQLAHIVEGVEYLRNEGGTSIFLVASGTYQFSWRQAVL
ncbi:MAG: glycoside hydrolase family 78 protein [Colwellia sp.]